MFEMIGLFYEILCLYSDLSVCLIYDSIESIIDFEYSFRIN